jgi:glycosyltransferase involved in cell wall biosynthesis
MIVVEAAAVGTPCVVTNDSGFRRQIEEHQAAYLVSPITESVTSAMAQLENSRALQHRLSANVKRLHEMVWTPEALVNELVASYQA